MLSREVGKRRSSTSTRVMVGSIKIALAPSLSLWLGSGPTAIDGHNRARHKVCFGRTHIVHHRSDLFRRAQAPHGLPRGQFHAHLVDLVRVILLQIAFDEW